MCSKEVETIAIPELSNIMIKNEKELKNKELISNLLNNLHQQINNLKIQLDNRQKSVENMQSIASLNNFAHNSNFQHSKLNSKLKKQNQFVLINSNYNSKV